MIAVVTISKESFLNYCQANDLDKNTAKQVCRLSDIFKKTFTDKVFIKGHENVSNYVLKNIIVDANN